MPRFKKVIEVQFPRMFAPEWIGRVVHLPRVSKFAIVSGGGGGGGKVATSRGIRQKQYRVMRL